MVGKGRPRTLQCGKLSLYLLQSCGHRKNLRHLWRFFIVTLVFVYFASLAALRQQPFSECLHLRNDFNDFLRTGRLGAVTSCLTEFSARIFLAIDI